MKRINYIRKDSLEAAEATIAQSEGRARPIAGGTDLLGGLKDAIYPSQPDTLVDVKSIESLYGVEDRDGGLYIGAMTRLRDLYRDPHIQQRCRAIAQAAESVASPQIRNMGTLAGNICQEPRCWYYRNPNNTFHCARKGGDTCHAMLGDNRFHSVFGSMRVEHTPCTRACPIQTDNAAYLELLRENRIDEAATMLLNVNPMPSITGRVCPHFCEQQCNRRDLDGSVPIGSIERFVGDHILDHPDRFLFSPVLDSGKAIGVVGAGPSGLSAAYFLRRCGHRVVVFDRMEEAGGMLRYAIPSFRLPKKIVDRFIDFLKKLGVEFTLGVEIGKEGYPSRLLADYDAIYMAGGAWSTPSIGLEGEEHASSGLAFLASVQQGATDAPGKRVLVIGGGNVAVDTAVTAKRLGAEQVFLACLERREEMPALQKEVHHALEEGIELLTSLGPNRILLSEGVITGAELIACTSVCDQNGCFSPSFDQTRKHTIKCDSVLLAVGQQPDDSLTEPGVETARGRLIADPITQGTNVEGIFAGGDAVTGPATVVEAIAAGKRAALGITEFLGTAHPPKDNLSKQLNRFARDALENSGRQEIELRAPQDRTWDEEDEAGLSDDQVLSEAKRCFSCGCVAVCPSDIAPVLTALEAKIITRKRAIPAEAFFAANTLSSTNLASGELVTGVFIPHRKNLRTSYLKFRIRNAIDFPVVSVAVALETEGNTVHVARIVLGAAAPVPLRARQAERFLEGKEPSKAKVAEAAEAAVRGAIPLKNNGYKINILKALVTRAVMDALI